MLSLAEKWSLRSDASSLCKHIDKYPENKRERFLSISEIERLSTVLKEISTHKTELPSAIAAIKLLLLTGCRLAEILTLKWEYIDIAHHRINFPDSKTGKKTVYISPYVIEVLDSIERKKGNPYIIHGAIEGKHLVNL
jgi:integrase